MTLKEFYPAIKSVPPLFCLGLFYIILYKTKYHMCFSFSDHHFCMMDGYVHLCERFKGFCCSALHHLLGFLKVGSELTAAQASVETQ